MTRAARGESSDPAFGGAVRSKPIIGFAILFAIFISLVIVLADTAHLGLLQRVYEFPYGDKAGHFFLHGTLTLLANLAFFELRRESSRRQVAWVVSLSIAVLVSLEELSQLWLPTRSPDWHDLLASYGGIAAALCLAIRLGALLRR